MGNRVIIVPAGGCNVEASYPRTCSALRDADFVVDAVTVPWKNVFAADVASVSEQVQTKIRPGSILLGHSYGAMLALLALAPRADVGVLLASPGVSCLEGLADERGRASIDRFYPGQASEVGKHSLRALTEGMRADPNRVAVLRGDDETPGYSVVHSMTEVAAQGFGIDVTCVPDAGHFIDPSASYVEAVVTAVQRISSGLRAAIS